MRFQWNGPHADHGGRTAGYDGLGRLTAFQRGGLSDANSDDVPDTMSTASDKTWTLDALGNWTSVTGEGSNRVHNRRNQLEQMSGATLTFDANGNMTTDETGKHFA